MSVLVALPRSPVLGLLRRVNPCAEITFRPEKEGQKGRGRHDKLKLEINVALLTDRVSRVGPSGRAKPGIARICAEGFTSSSHKAKSSHQ